MRRKLNSRRGETLVETLVAILILTLSVLAYYTMATTATRMNVAAKQEDEAYYVALAATEGRDPTAASPGEVTFTPEGGSAIVLDITWYDREMLHAYTPREGGSP